MPPSSFSGNLQESESGGAQGAESAGCVESFPGGVMTPAGGKTSVQEEARTALTVQQL